ncbi:MAG TPA: aminotransferase class I/II-fold pyridoxal phosphate-dependent enzyme [Candidatus Sulfotelmatobacter sp.]|nr:aminotransferase class I/II-fold pyridoxal phosphate-dependent enzyme [Candidatus Sulfotelmatobacter sp.]
MLNQRLDLLKDYPFQRLRDLIAEVTPPPGLAPIAMSLGEPQHPYPDLVGEVLHANRHLYGKYPPLAGTEEFRRAVAAWLTRRYRLPEGMIEPDRHVLPVAGTREGLYMIAFVAVPESKGGRKPAVLMPNPFYQCYAGAAVSAGAEPIYLAALPRNGFLPDLDALDAATLARTALVYLCSPANPQGTVADRDYLKRLIGLARAHDFVLVLDECYTEIYNDAPPPGGLEVCAALGGSMKNVVVFHSLSKRSSVPGLRSGFCAGDPDIISVFGRLRTHGNAGNPLPVFAAAAALWREETHVLANRALYQEKFRIAESIIGNRFGFYKPPGGFFLWLDVGDGEAAAKELYRKAAVTALPGRYLTREDGEGAAAGRPYIRVALVNDAATTREALERLGDALG